MALSQEDPKNAERVFFSRRVVSGVPWAIFSKLFVFLTYLSIPIIATRHLGAEKYGMFTLCQTIGEVATILCGLGLNTALVRFIPELLVNQNRAGLVRLLRKVAAAQATMVAVAVVVLYVAKRHFDSWFKVDFQHLLLLAALFAAAQVGKGFVTDTFTALFRVRAISMMSICHGIVWFGLTAVVLRIVPEVHAALLALIAPVVVVSIAGLFLLNRFIRNLAWRSPPFSIGKRRILGISFPSLLNSIAGVVLSQYSELFFLGVFFTPAVVGMYQLGCSVSLMVITFLPLALQNLFTSGFAEAYAKDQNCIGRLVSSFYKALIVIIVPFSALGVFFGPRAVEVIYGAHMKEAGPIAVLFFFLHSLNLFSAPLSMAVVTKEKMLQTQPLLVLQVVVNLILDYTLIPRYGMYGGVAAVFGTFVLTIPVRLYVVSRLIGGIYFPTRFFVKVALSVFLLAALLSPLAPELSLLGLFAVGLGYGAAYLVSIRFLRLIQEHDIADLRNLGFTKLNKALDILVGSAHA